MTNRHHRSKKPNSYDATPVANHRGTTVPLSSFYRTNTERPDNAAGHQQHAAFIAQLRGFLKAEELDALERKISLGQTTRQIANDLDVNNGTISRRQQAGVVKARILAAALKTCDVLQQLDATGITIHPVTCETAFQGYAVSKKQTQREFSQLPALQQTLDFLWAERKRLNFQETPQHKRQLYIGAWRDKEQSVWMLELTYVVPDYATAWALGILNRQSMMYDFHAEKNIPIFLPKPLDSD